VIIPSCKLSAYLDGIQFPVQILEEKGDRVARIEDREGLLELIEVDAVIGIGSWNRIRHLRLNRPVEELATLRVKLRVLPFATASKTVFPLRLDDGHRVHTFHGRRCSAYRQGRERLDYSAL
jgi:hypothetical protein